jgi:mannose-6-phosphate isomerase-like protein (cupin superfamily)
VQEERTMKKPRVINVSDVVGYSPPGDENSYVSRMLIDGQSVGSKNLIVNHFTLLPGHSTYLGRHPAPYEEVYYILAGEGVLVLGSEEAERYEVRPHTIAYISDETDHQLINTGSEPLEMLTLMPFHPTPGANTLYDERIREWGTSFRQIKPDEVQEKVS